MGYVERTTWSQLIASLTGTIVYLVLVLPQLWTTPVDGIAWQWPMVWTILGAIVLSIVLSVLWGIGAGMRDPDEQHRADVRDRDIERAGDRVGQAFLVVGALAALVLAMFELDWFWIGNAVFLGFFFSAFVGGIARVVIYRAGMA